MKLAPARIKIGISICLAVLGSAGHGKVYVWDMQTFWEIADWFSTNQQGGALHGRSDTPYLGNGFNASTALASLKAKAKVG